MLKLSDAITLLNGLGVRTAQKLNSIGIYTLEHLLFHLPNRYQNKTSITPLQNAQVGSEVLVELKIKYVEQPRSRYEQLVCYLADEQGEVLLLRFFRFNQSQRLGFVRGYTVQCFGELKIGKKNLEMHHPQYRFISKNHKPLLQHTFSPVYPLTADINQAQLKKWIAIVLKVLQATPSQDIFTKLSTNMPTLKQALITLHNPDKNTDMQQIANFKHIAQQRIIIEELCAHQLSLFKLKRQYKSKATSVFTIKNKLEQQLLRSLKFKLTKAQQRSINEINADISSASPMLRLLQGDVGSGKTIVAIFTCLQAVENNFQTAIMVPTEILANQHLQEFTNYLKPLGISIAFIIGSQNSKQRNEQLAKIKDFKAQIIIGTHALFQEKVVFNKLGLVIIDEQHKFGVHQRLSIAQKADTTPHKLVMTATPIPRSLTMSAYADLDLSTIDELPVNRKSIHTIAINSKRKYEVVKKIMQVCKNGGQVYWVCTLVEESEKLNAESVKNTYDYLKESLPDLSIMLIHGKIHKDEKKQIMHDFVNKMINVLVATTVIEVGIDVANASLMVIENSERLGLAQLHQLRGRVGRGENPSICILIYQSPLSKNAMERINILRQTNDGFLVAKKDLQLRGPGEVLGTQQTGIANMKIANIVRDGYLLKQAQYFSKHILSADDKYQKILIKRWIDGEKSKYAST